MATLEELRRQIDTTEQLQSVVKAMKSIAAVTIRQYERAVESIEQYNRSIEMGLQVVLSRGDVRLRQEREARFGEAGFVVFGSDQGMCGQFNERVVERALEAIRAESDGGRSPRVLAVGERVMAALEAEEIEAEAPHHLPGSVQGVTPLVQDIVLRIEQWRERAHVRRVNVLHNFPTSGASYETRVRRLLPLDEDWLRGLRDRDWESRCLPLFGGDEDRLFSALVREYIFVSLYRACAESIAAENASRIASMQSAERNIDDRLDALTGRFRRERQNQITEELFDVISGFEALTKR